ncbi:hypothetical protein SprV_0702350800 [Sparganum proliferum]
MEIHDFSRPSLSTLLTPASPLSQLEIRLTKLTGDMTSLQKPTFSSSPQNQPKQITPLVQSAHSARVNAVAICWCPTTFGAKTRRRIHPCSFNSKQTKRVKRVSLKFSTANLPGSSDAGHIFCVRNTRSCRRFLVDTGAQLGVISPTPADRRCPNPDLSLQAVNASSITNFDT